MAYLGTLILKLVNLRSKVYSKMVRKLVFGKVLMTMEIRGIIKSRRKELELFVEMELRVRMLGREHVQGMVEFPNGFIKITKMK